MTLKQGTSLREFLHWEFLKDLHINPKYLGEYLNHGQVLRAARGTHKMLDRIVNRGTRTLCLGRGVCEVLHHHLTRKVTISGNVGVGGCDNSSVVGMRHRVGKQAPNRLTFQPIHIPGVWTCPCSGLVPEARQTRRKEKEGFYFLQRVGTKSLAHICSSTESSWGWWPKSYLRGQNKTPCQLRSPGPAALGRSFSLILYPLFTDCDNDQMIRVTRVQVLPLEIVSWMWIFMPRGWHSVTDSLCWLGWMAMCFKAQYQSLPFRSWKPPFPSQLCFFPHN